MYMSTLECKIQDEWAYVVNELPDNLNDLAFKTGALKRKKGVKCAADLLRIILTYGVTDMSLKAVSAWATTAGVGQLSSVALYYRVKDSRDWLAALISILLERDETPIASADLDITLVDASVLTGPGAKGTEWRLHTGIDARTGHISSIKLTDQSGGESYKNYSVRKQEIMVGDRAYGMATGIAYVHMRGGYVVARANLHSIRLCRPDKTLFNALQEEVNVPKVGVAHYDILIPAPPETRSLSHKTWKLENASAFIPARLLGVRTIKNTIIWVITTVPQSMATDKVIMELYRVRWQIELEFKRLKSLLGLDALPSRQGPTAESWILARVLGAILIEKFLRKSGIFSPWGYRMRVQSDDRGHNWSRCTA